VVWLACGLAGFEFVSADLFLALPALGSLHWKNNAPGPAQ